jgi:acyl carrier protein
MFTAAIQLAADNSEHDLELTPGCELAALGIDSLAIVDLIVALEESLDIRIPTDLLTPEAFATIGALWEMCCEARAAAESDGEC